MIQVHILYSGTVVGVGFRFTVVRIASRLDLVGWIRNTSSGDVEILAEGKKENLSRLCHEIEEHFSGNIRNKEISQKPYEGKFVGFQIAY